MILADTNAILALVVGDREPENEAVVAVMEAAALRGEGIVVCEAVLVETCRVLRHTYVLQRDEIAEALEQLLGTRPIEARDQGEASAALALMRRKPVLALTDCLLAIRAARCEAQVLTFDRVLQRELAAEQTAE